MRPPVHRWLAAGALALLLPLAACDESGLSTSGSADVLVQNARAARVDGDYEGAQRILDAARAAYPTDASVRTEYAVLLLERDGVNLFDLERLATYLEDTPPAATGPSPLPAGTFCPFATAPQARRIDPTAFAGYAEIAASAETLDAVLALLDPVIPNLIQSAPLCGDAVTTQPAPTFDRAAAASEMRAAGLTDAEIGAALAANTLARSLRAYLTLTTDLEQPTAWYLYGANQELGVCAPDPRRLQADAETAVADFGEGVHSLDLRASVVGTSAAGDELVERLRDGYTELRDAFGTYCAL